MNDQKILFLAILVLIYGLYRALWFTTENAQETIKLQPPANAAEAEFKLEEITKKSNLKTKSQPIPLFVKNACSVLEVFAAKRKPNCKETKKEEMEAGGNAVTVIGITLFLIVLTVNAVLDVIKVKEEERARRKLNPEADGRQSLAEFANKKLRRESSKFGLQLFQIAENTNNTNSDDEKKAQKPKQYTRGDSTNSYLTENKVQDDNSAPASIGDSQESKLVKRQSAAKLGARPSAMVRRSSFPALHLNPDIQAAMLGHRQNSVDSDDEDRGRRVRFIRRY